MTPKILPVVFYETASGRAPVRDFLMELTKEDRRSVSVDIASVEYGWPIGMPVCRSLDRNLWEIRTLLPGQRIVRIIFTPYDGKAVLLHAFFKKTQKTPKKELDTAFLRLKDLLEAQDHD